jgi:flagellar basal-body rod modification protein FlgD
VRLDIYGLDGRLVAQIDGGLQDAGRREFVWDGRDEHGQPLAPGLYLFSIGLETQAAQTRTLHSLGIAY